MIGSMLTNVVISGLPNVFTTILSASTLEFDKAAESLCSPQEKAKIQKLVGKKSELLGFKKEVEVKVSSTPLGAKAHGTHFLPFRCGITIDTKELPFNVLGFTVAHELSHIKSNDLLTIPVVGLLAATLSSIALTILFPGAVGVGIGIAIFVVSSVAAHIARAIFSQYREAQADKKALTACTLLEKQGAISYFKEMQKSQQTYRNEEEITEIGKFFRKLEVSATGENRLDIFHPSLQSRISMIQKSIKDEIGESHNLSEIDKNPEIDNDDSSEECGYYECGDPNARGYEIKDEDEDFE